MSSSSTPSVLIGEALTVARYIVRTRTLAAAAALVNAHLAHPDSLKRSYAAPTT